MSDAWGGSWGTSWGTSWTYTTGVEPNAFACGVFDPTAFDTNCPPAAAVGGHDGTKRRRKRARVIKYHEFATLEEREAALANAIAEAEIPVVAAPEPLAPEVDEQIRKMERILKKYREERAFMDIVVKVLLH